MSTRPQRMRLIIWLLMCISILASEKKLIFIRGKISRWIRHIFSSQNPHNVCVAAVWIADAEGISEDQIRHYGLSQTTTSFYSSLFACSRELSPSARRRTAANRRHELMTERRSSPSESWDTNKVLYGGDPKNPR